MAKNSKRVIKLGGLLVIILGIVLAVLLVGEQTNWFNLASGPSGRYVNLNKANEITSANNPDGTMGPQTSFDNWSNSLSETSKGELIFAVTDPPQDGKPEGLPTQAQGKAVGLGEGNGPQVVTALNLTITKVEVHLAYLGQPGEKGNKGQVDHWETLNIATPITVDLVDLAKTKSFSTLGITTLAEGKYTEVRLYLSKATATLSNGSVKNLTILGKDNIVRVVRPFSIIAGQTTKLTIDFDAQHSVIKAGKTYLLKPVVSRLIEEK